MKLLEKDCMSDNIIQGDYKDILNSLEKNTVDLILTDPPYGISRETNFHTLKFRNSPITMDFGEWDKVPNYTDISNEAFRVLRPGGTAIVWCSIWQISHLAEAMGEAGFKILRHLVWEKTNPVPLNITVAYLSNARENAVVGVKGGKATFNARYHTGAYRYPIPRHGGNRVHPTQKCVKLFTELVEVHSNENDLVVDPFLGSGTTAEAAISLGRRFYGGDIDQQYVDLSKQRIEKLIS